MFLLFYNYVTNIFIFHSCNKGKLGDLNQVRTQTTENVDIAIT